MLPGSKNYQLILSEQHIDNILPTLITKRNGILDPCKTPHSSMLYLTN